jgi:hypothetical protein
MSLEMVVLPPRLDEVEVSVSMRMSLRFWREGGGTSGVCAYHWLDGERSMSVAMKAYSPDGREVSIDLRVGGCDLRTSSDCRGMFG